MKKRELILIAGGTASGKTMVAEQLKEEYEKAGHSVTLLTIDNYYKTLDQLNVKEHSEVNWDDPNSFDWERLMFDAKKALEGEEIVIRQYNYGTGFYEEEETILKPAEKIIIEGIYALYNEELRNMSDTSIYVDVDSDIRLMRRIKRDSKTRYSESFDSDEFVKTWEEKIKPMHNKYIRPTKQYASLIFKNDKQLPDGEKSSLIDLLHSLMVK